jgi:hypothetical protein
MKKEMRAVMRLGAVGVEKRKRKGSRQGIRKIHEERTKEISFYYYSSIHA